MARRIDKGQPVYRGPEDRASLADITSQVQESSGPLDRRTTGPLEPMGPFGMRSVCWTKQQIGSFDRSDLRLHFLSATALPEDVSSRQTDRG